MEKNNGRLTIISNIGKRKLFSVKPQSIAKRKELQELLAARETFCITKDGNPDSICAPAILLHNKIIKQENIIFTNYKEFEGLFRYLKKAKIENSAIVFNDIGISAGNLSCSIKIIRLLKSRNNILIWIDDHPWSDDIVNSVRNELDFAVFGQNSKYCATELVYLILCKQDSTGGKIAMLAHYADFALKSKYDGLIRRLQYSIVYLLHNSAKDRNLCRVINAVSKLDFENELIVSSYKNYLMAEAKNMKALLKNSYTAKTTKYLVGLGFSKRLQTNSACAALERALNSEINIYLDIETWDGGIRSKKGIDGSLIAKRLRGGGHPQASGFSINPPRLKNSNKSDMERFFKKIERISKALYG